MNASLALVVDGTVVDSVDVDWNDPMAVNAVDQLGLNTRLVKGAGQ